MPDDAEKEALYEIMRQASYLRRGSAARKEIERTVSEELRRYQASPIGRSEP